VGQVLPRIVGLDIFGVNSIYQQVLMLRTRLITALILIPIVIAGVFAGGLLFLLGTMIFGVIAGWEFGQMMKVGGYKTAPFFTLALIVLLILNSYRSDLSLECILSLLLLASLVWQLFQVDSPAPTVDWALTVAGGLYIGWSLAHLVALRQLENGLGWVWLALLATWGADTFAYLVGRKWGRHKLWPRLSPKKTWEGLIGSIGGGLVGAAGAAALFNLDWGASLLIGAIVPVVGMFGDVSISMMKRQVGVKDSSNLLPGHGGMLDRLDSLLFVNIVVYYYVVWHGAILGYLISSSGF
jgi:phosphatidate cytidylyltransferase